MMARNVEHMKKVMDEVYGKCTDARNWVPKKYKDTKNRYLWTDAFGVCNYLTLFCETKDEIYLNQADALIKDVHDTLGKDRSLKERLGKSTDARPLLGGLRIGKEEPEGYPDGDGQYFHYLTKWMFALNRMSLVKSDRKYNDWAIDLAKESLFVAHETFIRGKQSESPRMFWNLTHPHVDSEGNLDPFDGYVTYKVLQGLNREALTDQIKTFEKMVLNKYPHYRSKDPLDLGEALWITHLVPNEEWSNYVSSVSLQSLESLYSLDYFRMPEPRRLAFREFGTTIGAQVHPSANLLNSSWHSRVAELHEYWQPKIYKRDHDITPVMYCTSIIPGVFWVDYPPLKNLAAP